MAQFVSGRDLERAERGVERAFPGSEPVGGGAAGCRWTIFPHDAIPSQIRDGRLLALHNADGPVLEAAAAMRSRVASVVSVTPRLANAS